MGETLSAAGQRGQILRQILRAVVISMALFFTLQFFYIALSRISYPYELEWFEGVLWQQTNLLLHTGQIYVEPSLDFISTLYAPVFMFLSAGFTSLFGHTFVMMRVVSLLSVIGSAIIIYRIVHKYSESHFGAIASLGLYFGSYSVSGFWYDIGRVDSLQLFMMLATLSFVLSKNKLVFYLSPAIATFALFTKQSSLLMIILLGGALLLTERFRGVYFLGITAVLSTGVIILLQSWSGGWFWYYVVELPAGHPWTLSMILNFWFSDIFTRYAPAFTAFTAACAFTLITFFKKNSSHPVLFAWLLSCLVISYSSRIHEGGADNVLIPLHAAFAIATGLVAGHILKKATVGKKLPKALALNVVLAAIVLQLGLLFYLPEGRIPTEEDRAYGDKLVNFARNEPGRILFLGSPYINDLAGKRSNAHELTIIAVINAKTTRDDVKNRLIEEFRRNVVLGEYDAIVINHDIFSAFMRKLVKENYYEADRLLPDGPAFEHVSGEPLKPRFLMLPRNPQGRAKINPSN